MQFSRFIRNTAQCAHVIFTVCRKEFQFRAFSFGQSYSAHRAEWQAAAAFQMIWCRSTKSTWCTSTATAGEEGGWVAVKLQPGEDEAWQEHWTRHRLFRGQCATAQNMGPVHAVCTCAVCTCAVFSVHSDNPVADQIFSGATKLALIWIWILPISGDQIFSKNWIFEQSNVTREIRNIWCIIPSIHSSDLKKIFDILHSKYGRACMLENKLEVAF